MLIVHKITQALSSALDFAGVHQLAVFGEMGNVCLILQVLVDLMRHECWYMCAHLAEQVGCQITLVKHRASHGDEGNPHVSILDNRNDLV
jgi:hypothetical protein